MSKELGEWLASLPEPTPATHVAPQPPALPPKKNRVPRLWFILGAALIVVFVATVIILLSLNRPENSSEDETLALHITSIQEQLAEVDANIDAAQVLTTVQNQELRDLRAQLERLQGANETALPQADKNTLAASLTAIAAAAPAEAASAEAEALQGYTAGAGQSTEPAPLLWLDASVEQMRTYLGIEVARVAPVQVPDEMTEQNEVAMAREYDALATALGERAEELNELEELAAEHTRLATQLATDLVGIALVLPERAAAIATANPDVPESHQSMYDAAARAVAIANAQEVVRLADGQVRLPGDVPEMPADAVLLPLTDAERGRLLLGALQSFVDTVAVVADAQAVAEAAPDATAVLPGGVVPNPGGYVPPVVDGGGSGVDPGPVDGGGVPPAAEPTPIPTPTPTTDGGSGGGDTSGGSADGS